MNKMLKIILAGSFVLIGIAGCNKKEESLKEPEIENKIDETDTTDEVEQEIEKNKYLLSDSEYETLMKEKNPKVEQEMTQEIDAATFYLFETMLNLGMEDAIKNEAANAIMKEFETTFLSTAEFKVHIEFELDGTVLNKYSVRVIQMNDNIQMVMHFTPDGPRPE